MNVSPGIIPPELAASSTYTDVREIGQGGMGVVYLAKNRLMDRWEVLKLVHRGLIHDGSLRERFLREIRAAGQLLHPNVVVAYSAQDMGGTIVLAMEYVPGETLDALVKRAGPMSIRRACTFASQVALGLQQAFERGMVHRDIKPGNILCTNQNKKTLVKVVDFGLAKFTSEAVTDGNLTGSGKCLGTPLYMAPEQARDATTADIRADIYSLGATLFFLLTGRPPFSGRTYFDTIQLVLNEPAPPVQSIRPDVPPELAAVVAKMLAKNPGERFQTPAQVAQVLLPLVKRAPDSIGPVDLIVVEGAQDTGTAAPITAVDRSPESVPARSRGIPIPSRSPLRDGATPYFRVPVPQRASGRTRPASAEGDHETQPHPPVGESQAFRKLSFVLLAICGTFAVCSGLWYAFRDRTDRDPVRDPDRLAVANVSPAPSPAPKAAPVEDRLPDPPPPPPVDPALQTDYEDYQRAASVAGVKAFIASRGPTCLSRWKTAADQNDAIGLLLYGRCYDEGVGVEKNPERAFELFHRSAKLENPYAMCNLGLCYERGKGVAADPKEAVWWYRRAAVLDNNPGMALLADAYQEGKGVPQNHTLAVEWFTKAADRNDTYALISLGRCYYGTGVGKNLVEAARRFRKAADLNNAEAAGILGLCYEQGEGVAKDAVEAVGWYRKAAAGKDAAAMFALGRCHHDGIGVEQNYPQAVQYYLASLEAGGGPIALNHLGACYFNGHGVAEDKAKAVEFYLKAAKANLPIAMLNLGLCYEFGTGVPVDAIKAVEWYRKAETLKEPEAMFALGRCYHAGIGVEKDYPVAVQYYRASIAAGGTLALNNLGACYFHGHGVKQDKTEAVKLYLQAANAGNAVAMKNLVGCYTAGDGVPVNTAEAEKWQKKLDATEKP